MDMIGLAVLFLAVGVLALWTISVVPESQRLVLTACGRFAKLRGPGIVLTWPGGPYLYHRLSIGTVGEVGSNDIFCTDELAVPYVSESSLGAGSRAKVVGFSGEAVRVEPVCEAVVCERCGHRNEV